MEVFQKKHVQEEVAELNKLLPDQNRKETEGKGGKKKSTNPYFPPPRVNYRNGGAFGSIMH